MQSKIQEYIAAKKQASHWHKVVETLKPEVKSYLSASDFLEYIYLAKGKDSVKWDAKACYEWLKNHPKMTPEILEKVITPIIEEEALDYLLLKGIIEKEEIPDYVKVVVPGRESIEIPENRKRKPQE